MWKNGTEKNPLKYVQLSENAAGDDGIILLSWLKLGTTQDNNIWNEFYWVLLSAPKSKLFSLMLLVAAEPSRSTLARTLQLFLNHLNERCAAYFFCSISLSIFWPKITHAASWINCLCAHFEIAFNTNRSNFTIVSFKKCFSHPFSSYYSKFFFL